MKKFFIGLLGLIGVILVLSAIAPTELHVEREIIINKPKDFVFNQIKFIKNHQAWSPWEKKDPNITKSYKGEDGTVGFVVSWSGNDEVGTGEQEIKSIVEGERIDLELRFKEPMEDTSHAYLITEAVSEDQTKVRWGLNGRLPFPGNVICFLFNMKGKLAKEFEHGLQNLKTHLEAI